MKFTGRFPKRQGIDIRMFPNVRSGGGPLSVGDFVADAFTQFSQFDAYMCLRSGFTELSRKAG